MERMDECRYEMRLVMVEDGLLFTVNVWVTRV